MKIRAFLLPIVLMPMPCLAAQQYVKPDVAASYKINLAQQTKVLAKNKTIKWCSTHPEYPSSPWIRQLTYKALKHMGHPAPEIVIVVNKPNGEFCSGPVYVPVIRRTGIKEDAKARGIQIDEEAAKKQSYGITRAIVFHEAYHLVKKHYYVKNKGSKAYYLQCHKDENAADRAIVTYGGCYTCACEAAQKFASQSTAFTWDEIQKMTSAQLEENIKKVESQKLDREHPCNAERAMRLLLLTKQKLKPADLCTYHKSRAHKGMQPAPKKAVEKKKEQPDKPKK